MKLHTSRWGAKRFLQQVMPSYVLMAFAQNTVSSVDRRETWISQGTVYM
jgi:hypothetical protein